jgi:hypothetical protein
MSDGRIYFQTKEGAQAANAALPGHILDLTDSGRWFLKPDPAALDWRAMFVRYVQQVIYHESYDFLDEIEWTPEEEAAVQQAAEEARRR